MVYRRVHLHRAELQQLVLPGLIKKHLIVTEQRHQLAGQRAEEKFEIWQRFRVRSDFMANRDLRFRFAAKVDTTWGTGTYTAEADETVQLYAEEGTPAPQCTIDGPAVGEGTIQTSGFGNEGREWDSFDSFTAEEAGDYTIDCGGTPVMVGPPVSIGGIFAGLGGILLAIGGGVLGFLLLMVGVIILLVRRGRD